MFDENTSQIIDSVETLARKVDSKKLKAIGEKSRLEAIDELESKRQQEMQKELDEREKELERFESEYQSLLKIEQEQRVTIEKLINNQTN